MLYSYELYYIPHVFIAICIYVCNTAMNKGLRRAPRPTRAPGGAVSPPWPRDSNNSNNNNNNNNKNNNHNNDNNNKNSNSNSNNNNNIMIIKNTNMLKIILIILI